MRVAPEFVALAPLSCLPRISEGVASAQSAFLHSAFKVTAMIIST